MIRIPIFTKPILMVAFILSSCPVQGKQRRFSRFTRAFSDQIANCCIYFQNSKILKCLHGAFLRIFRESSKQNIFLEHLLLARPLHRSCLQGKKFWLQEEKRIQNNSSYSNKVILLMYLFFFSYFNSSGNLKYHLRNRRGSAFK